MFTKPCFCHILPKYVKSNHQYYFTSNTKRIFQSAEKLVLYIVLTKDIIWTSEKRKRMKQEKHQKLKLNTRPRRNTSTMRRSEILCVEKEKLCYKRTALIIRTLNSQCGRHYHQTLIFLHCKYYIYSNLILNFVNQSYNG